MARGQGGARRTVRSKTLRLLAGGAVLLALAALAVALAASRRGGGAAARVSPPGPQLSRPDGASLPRQIAANVKQANRVIDASIRDQLTSLKGVPVVVNQWASWCPNCKAEFPFFQDLARRYRAQVAFVGLDAQDTRHDAERFLKQHPVDYPSVFDHSAAQAASLGGGQAWPTTIFFNAAGQRTHVHIGSYATEQTLAADIQRYAEPDRG